MKAAYRGAFALLIASGASLGASARVLLLGSILVLTSCATASGFAWNYEPSSFAGRMGVRGCAVSVPLTSDQVIEGAKLEGNPSPETHGEWINMKAEFREGDQLRYVNCSGVKNTMGTAFYALVRKNVIILKFVPMLY